MRVEGLSIELTNWNDKGEVMKQTRQFLNRGKRAKRQRNVVKNIDSLHYLGGSSSAVEKKRKELMQAGAERGLMTRLWVKPRGLATPLLRSRRNSMRVRKWKGKRM
jgi:hypothetical protein